MRLLPGFSLAFLLALLLSGTTPMGTGAGLHQFDLVHPLFAHVHILNGRVLTHDQVQPAASVGATTRTPGPAFGAGSGGNEGFGGVGISLMVPACALRLMPGLLVRRAALEPRPLSGHMLDGPPDPPPTSAA